MKVQCTGCNKTLEVPEKFAGRQVACPVCKGTISVPETGDAELSDEELQVRNLTDNSPAPLRSTVDDAGSRARARRNLASASRPRGKSKSKEPEAGEMDYCPSCGSPLIGGAVVCTFCGYDLRARKKVLGARESILPKLWGLLGPILALALVFFGGTFLYRKYIESKDKDKEGRQDTKPVRALRPTARDMEGLGVDTGPAAPMKRSANAYTGGAVRSELTLADASDPYRLDKDILIHPEGTLKIGPGVRIEGSGGITGSGKFLVDAGSDNYAEIAVPVLLSPHGSYSPEVKAEGVYFLAPVQFDTPKGVDIKSAFFVAGVTFDLAVIKGRRIDVVLTKCRFNGRDPVLSLDIKGNITQTRFRVDQSDIMGTISGRIGAFSAVDFSSCFWEMPAAEAIAGILGDGEKIIEPVLTEPVMGPKGRTAKALKAPTAAPAIRIENSFVSMAVPPGWNSGGKKAVWKQSPRGSVVVMLLDERMPQGELGTFVDLQKRRFVHLDRNLQLQQIDPPLTGKPGFTDYRFELLWEGVPYRIYYHLTFDENHVLGAIVSAPDSLWQDNEKQIIEMLDSMQRKEG